MASLGREDHRQGEGCAERLVAVGPGQAVQSDHRGSQIGVQPAAAQRQKSHLVGPIELHEIEPACGQDGSLPQPFMSQARLDSLHVCRVGDRFGRASEHQERESAGREHFFGIRRASYPSRAARYSRPGHARRVPALARGARG